MQSRATISSEITSSFPTNAVKYITAQFLRAFQEIINYSFFNLVDDNLSNIQFSRPDFQAGNALEAVVDLAQMSRPIFWIEISSSGAFISLDDTNHPDITTAGGGSNHALNFNSIYTATGANIRKEYWMVSLTDTRIEVSSEFLGSTPRRFYLYQDIPETSYLINS